MQGESKYSQSRSELLHLLQNNNILKVYITLHSYDVTGYYFKTRAFEMSKIIH